MREVGGELEEGSDTRGWLEREIETEYQQIREATLIDPEKPFPTTPSSKP